MTSTLGEVRPEHDREPGSDLVLVHYVRGLRLPIIDVWGYLTEPELLATWFGAVSGDPRSGQFSVDGMDVRVGTRQAPHRLEVTIDGGALDITLHQVGAVTTLELVRRHLHPADAAEAGPKWQCYLDRLEAAIAGEPLPAQAEYRQVAAEYR